MSHANTRTNVFARRLIVERVATGWPPAHVAEQLGISRATVYKWLRRYDEGGDAALADRSSRPIRMSQRISDRVEQKVLAARRRRKRGAVVLAAELKLNPSTVGRILARHQVAHLMPSTRLPASRCAPRGAAPTATNTAPRDLWSMTTSKGSAAPRRWRLAPTRPRRRSVHRTASRFRADCVHSAARRHRVLGAS